MSIVENHDIVQMGLNIQGEKERCKKILEGKNDWQDASGEQREKVLSSQRAQLITADRKNICLSMDHMILDKKEFRDEWIVGFGNTRARLRSGARYSIKNRFLRKADQGGDIRVIPIDPMQVNGFVNLRNKYQYFQIAKVCLRFTSNKSMNFAPILCKYYPPGTPVPATQDPNFFAQLTKTSIAKGGDGYMSLFKPRCNIQFNIGSTTSPSSAKWIEMPYMSNVLMRANYDEKRFYYDYGAFVFVNRASDDQQILATVEFKIDFYTGIDMNNLSEGYWGGEDGGDDQPSDGEQDPSDGEGDGDGDGEGDGSGSGNPNGNGSAAPEAQAQPAPKPSGRNGRVGRKAKA